jgi:hypothetical protein
MRQEFEYLNSRSDLPTFLADLRKNGWIINPEETYMTATSLVYVAYR